MDIRIEMTWADGADQTFGLPAYETEGAAGCDLRANFLDRGQVVLKSSQRALIPTGLHMALPKGVEAQIRPRSGLALKHGVTVLNSPGTIDSDYRGPVGIILMNHGSEDFVIAHGDRIAQMVIAPCHQASFSEVAILDKTSRGAGGFGSTGS